ncbi:MAG: outer membrane beta-barrel protein [Candidatus Jettenia sp. CY-1]|nr:MAG: outer membrane beta-barrel protein [Candidatus Jettenia sp. CY-1]
MNNLIKYFKTTFLSFVVFFAAFFIAANPNAYSFDYHEPVLSVTNFLDSLSYDYKGFNIKLTGISVGETYDDNVTFEHENEKDDFITDASIGFGISYMGKASSFELVGNLHSQAFMKNNEFNNISEDIDFSFNHEFSENDRLSVKNFFVYSEAPLFFRDDFFDEQFVREGGRFKHYTNRFNIDYTKDISKQISVTVRYMNDLNAFSEVDIQTSYLNSGGFEIGYLLSSATRFSVSYDILHRQFENAEDALVNTITTGIRQYITKKLYFDGGVGIDFIDSFDDKNYTRPLYFASVTYEVDEKTSAGISFLKKNSTNAYTADIFNEWRTAINFKRQILERFGCAFSVFYGDGEYASSNFQRELFGVKTNLTYDINKNLRANLAYSYSDLSSNVETTEYEKNTIFLGLIAEF